LSSNATLIHSSRFPNRLFDDHFNNISDALDFMTGFENNDGFYEEFLKTEALMFLSLGKKIQVYRTFVIDRR
jgi:hypothetical protein